MGPFLLCQVECNNSTFQELLASNSNSRVLLTNSTLLMYSLVKRAGLFEYNNATFVVHCCTLLQVVGSLRDQMQETFCPHICAQTMRELRKQKKCIVAQHLLLQHFLSQSKLPSTTYNTLQHVSTCMKKVIKRLRLFRLDKCWM